MRYIWKNVIKNKPVENDYTSIQQDAVENYNAPVQRDVVKNYNALVQQDPVENYNVLVQQDKAVDEEITHSAEDLMYSNRRSIFVDGTSLDFVYWNSYVTLNTLYIL